MYIAVNFVDISSQEPKPGFDLQDQSQVNQRDSSLLGELCACVVPQCSVVAIDNHSFLSSRVKYVQLGQ